MFVGNLAQEYRPSMGTFRTILRRSFYTAVALSTLLLLATLIFWWVSYHHEVRTDYVNSAGNGYAFGGQEGRAFVVSEPLIIRSGVDQITIRSLETDSENDWSYLTWNSARLTFILAIPVNTSSSLGVLWCHSRGIVTLDKLYIPFSYLTLLFSILPLLAFRSIRRRRQAARFGLCPKCGYDLRAQQTGAGGAVCPECGTPVAGRGPSPGDVL